MIFQLGSRGKDELLPPPQNGSATQPEAQLASEVSPPQFNICFMTKLNIVLSNLCSALLGVKPLQTKPLHVLVSEMQTFFFCANSYFDESQQLRICLRRTRGFQLTSGPRQFSFFPSEGHPCGSRRPAVTIDNQF